MSPVPTSKPAKPRSDKFGAWISVSEVEKWEKEAERLGVSEVARGKKGFLWAYKRAGDRKRMEKTPVDVYNPAGLTWGEKRNAFLSRSVPQFDGNRTYRRWLSLVMWAYVPPGPIPERQ